MLDKYFKPLRIECTICSNYRSTEEMITNPEGKCFCCESCLDKYEDWSKEEQRKQGSFALQRTICVKTGNHSGQAETFPDMQPEGLLEAVDKIELEVAPALVCLEKA